MHSLYSSAEPPEKPSLERLMSAPLPVLLREVSAEVVDSEIDDRRFLGGVAERHDGSLVLSLPATRGDAERDLVARCLLVDVLGVK